MAFRTRSGAARHVDVLAVCTGNVCRSPYIAAVLHAGAPGLVVASAGTAALVGQPPSQHTVAELEARGLAVGDLTARLLTRRLVRDARLIVTASRAHRVSVAALDATAGERAFTLKELSRLLAGCGPVGIDGALALARRAVRAERVDHDDDLDDPFGLERSAHARMAAEVDAAVAVVAPVLSPVHP